MIFGIVWVLWFLWNNVQAYLSVIVDQVYPVMLMVCPARDGYFQQDNASCHKVGIVRKWFKEHGRDFTLLSRPAQSPDHNPSENLWDENERCVRHLDPVPPFIKELKSAVHRIWFHIPYTTYHHIIYSIPKKNPCCIKGKSWANIVLRLWS